MKKDRDDEIEREIRTHLELEAEDRVADGMTETEAQTPGFAHPAT